MWGLELVRSRNLQTYVEVRKERDSDALGSPPADVCGWVVVDGVCVHVCGVCVRAVASTVRTITPLTSTSTFHPTTNR